MAAGPVPGDSARDPLPGRSEPASATNGTRLITAFGYYDMFNVSVCSVGGRREGRVPFVDMLVTAVEAAGDREEERSNRPPPGGVD